MSFMFLFISLFFASTQELETQDYWLLAKHCKILGLLDGRTSVRNKECAQTICIAGAKLARYRALHRVLGNHSIERIGSTSATPLAPRCCKDTNKHEV